MSLRSHLAFLLLASSLLTHPLQAGSQVIAKKAALATAHPLSTRAGLSILQRGGNAADAAVAVAFALAVVHPQGGNLGGGGFLVYYDARTRGVWTLDFRETAPRAVAADMFAKQPASGIRAAAIPGTVAGLEALHTKFGSRAWKDLLAPALAITRDGARTDPELAADIELANSTRKLEIPATPPPPELALTLQRLAEEGPRDFYEGQIATKLVDAVRTGGGVFGFRDLREYEPQWRAPLKLRYGPYEIYTAPPPSGGGLVIGETLNILSSDDLAATGFQTAKTVHLLVEAQRRAFIDESRYVSDPLGARIPYRELLSQARAEAWRKTIDPNSVIVTSALADPRPVGGRDSEHTTHFTIADEEGNIVSLTTSLGDDFGSGVLATGLGFFLNTALADFTTRPNTIGPGKRPVSHMSPILVLRDGRPFLAMGSRGGKAIPTTLAQVFQNVVVYGKSLADAIAAPRYHHQAVPEDVYYERKLAPKELTERLHAMGHGIVAREAIGDVHAIQFEPGRLTAVSDPRRGGAAGGY
jgi:gamma-glutamyltranspeptidase/glutathione hydrolase